MNIHSKIIIFIRRGQMRNSLTKDKTSINEMTTKKKIKNVDNTVFNKLNTVLNNHYTSYY